MRQKQNEILGWIHPELFNLKWLIPYKAQADPSSVLINTLSRFLNWKQAEEKGMGLEKITFPSFLLCFVSESVSGAKLWGLLLTVEVDENVFFSKHLGLTIANLFISVRCIIISCMKTTEVDKDVTPI